MKQKRNRIYKQTYIYKGQLKTMLFIVNPNKNNKVIGCGSDLSNINYI